MVHGRQYLSLFVQIVSRSICVNWHKREESNLEEWHQFKVNLPTFFLVGNYFTLPIADKSLTFFDNMKEDER
jgi:hypothetical protein